MSRRSLSHKKRRLSLQNDNYLENAEMTLEDNYNQIDGIINNQKTGSGLTGGQNYDDMQKSEQEVLREERRSVLERLEQAREHTRAVEAEDSCRVKER